MTNYLASKGLKKWKKRVGLRLPYELLSVLSQPSLRHSQKSQFTLLKKENTKFHPARLISRLEIEKKMFSPKPNCRTFTYFAAHFSAYKICCFVQQREREREARQTCENPPFLPCLVLYRATFFSSSCEHGWCFFNLHHAGEIVHRREKKKTATKKSTREGSSTCKKSHTCSLAREKAELVELWNFPLCCRKEKKKMLLDYNFTYGSLYVDALTMAQRQSAYLSKSVVSCCFCCLQDPWQGAASCSRPNSRSEIVFCG